MFAPASNPTKKLFDAARSSGSRPAFESGLSPLRQPFLYITAAFIAGILLDRWLAVGRPVAATLAIIAMVISIKLIAERKSLAATLVLLAGFASFGALLSAGERAAVTGPRLKRLFDERIITPDDPVELTGVLIAPPEPAPQAFYLDVEAESIRARGAEMTATGCARLMIYLADEEAAIEFDHLALDYGSRLSLLVRLERARSYRNPGSPDFNDFLERRGYDLKGVIKSSLLIQPSGRAPVSGLLRGLYHLRLRLMGAIDTRFNAPVAGTLKAMLAGNNYFLDQRTSERLRESATFHTLVISGFHISIIAWVLLRVPVSVASLKLLKEPSKLHRHGALRTLASMLALWGYAVMVGLAPPVTRAAVMITVGLIAPLIFRRSASVNTVSLAAFIMLALKPALVADPGFQLSFIAVMSIVGLALPLINTLRVIGEWRPAASAPHPPKSSRFIKAFAEAIFWDERKFDREMRGAPIRYRLDKSRAARLLSRSRLQSAARAVVSLAITSIVIQLCALPLMAFYFNRVSLIGMVLNITAGLLTTILMLAALAAIALSPLSLWAAAKLVSVANAAHYLLAHSIDPFAGISFAAFRVAHYEGWQGVIYALYFIPLAMLAAFADRWRPVDYLFPIDRMNHATEQRSLKQNSPKPSAVSNEPVNRNPSSLRLSLSFWLLALLASFIAVICPAARSPNGKLTVHFLDVGQGDAALVIFPRGATMLIDAGGEFGFDRRMEKEKREKIQTGNNNTGEEERSEKDGGEEESESEFNDGGFPVGEAVVSRFLWSEGRTRIDYALATHAHRDHIGGLSDVLKNFRVGQALVGHAPVDDAEFRRFREAVKKRAITLSEVSAGERFEIEGVRIEILWPPRSYDDRATSGNDDSVTLRLVYGSISILLAGDIEQRAEALLTGSGVDLRADVLKVPHHGSKTSSTDAFLDRAQPRCAVISVGERSRFGHPHAVVVSRYLKRGAKLFQTGRDGMISVETDGTALNVATYSK